MLICFKNYLKITILGLIFAQQAILCHDWLNDIPSADLMTWCKKNLENEERSIQKEIFTLIQVQDLSEWQQTKQNLCSEYQTTCTASTAEEQAPTPLPEMLITPIQNVLKNDTIRSLLGIHCVKQDQKKRFIKAYRNNGTTITFACGTEKIKADAATDQFTILICPEEIFETHASTTEIEATLAHELIHIVHDDDFNIYCLNNLYNSKRHTSKISAKKFAKLRGQWERLQEKRADLLAGALKPDYAQASMDQFERNIPAQERFKPTNTHPGQAERAVYMEKLINASKNAPPHSDDTTTGTASLNTFFIFLILGVIFFVVMLRRELRNFG
jgi:hypothetical protein